MSRPLEPQPKLGWVLGDEFRFDPHAGPARLSAKQLADDLRSMGRVESIDESSVMTAVLLGEAVDADPTNAALWGQFRSALTDLRSVGAGDDGDSFAQLIAELSAPVPNPEVAQPANSRTASRKSVTGARANADAASSTGGRRRRGTTA